MTFRFLIQVTEWMDVPYSYKERIIHFQVEWMGIPYSDKKKIVHFQVYHRLVSFRSDRSFWSSVVDACVHLECNHLQNFASVYICLTLLGWTDNLVENPNGMKETIRHDLYYFESVC